MDNTFIHTADLHLGLKFHNKWFSIKEREKRRRELWETFDKIIDIADKDKIKYLFICGDLLEEEYCTFGDIKRISSRLADIKDTRVIITSGNHDPYDENSLYKFIDWSNNVYIIESTQKIQKIEFKDDNICIYSIGWDKKEENKEKEDIYKINTDESKINILLLHCDVIDKNSKYLPINKELIKNKFDYCALGHIHKFTEIDENIIYPGTPEPLDFSETGSHGIIKGILDKNKIVKEFVTLAKRKFIIREINIEADYDFNKILDLIKYSGDTFSNTRDYIRIKLKGTVDKDISVEDLKYEAQQFFYYIEFEDEFLYDLDVEQVSEQNKGNIVEEYIKQFENSAKHNKIAREALRVGLEVLIREKVVK